jgi:hypothetical protein
LALLAVTGRSCAKRAGEDNSTKETHRVILIDTDSINAYVVCIGHR